MNEYIEVGQPLQFTDPNTPTRVGEIVENVSDIYNIPSPRLGMQVFVKSEKKSFVITSLKDKAIGGVDVPEAAVEAFELVGAKSFTWNNDTDPSNMNDFVVAGVYDIKGERTRIDDNLPILNTGGGHSFNARLTVLDSSIPGDGKNDDKCITQVLSFSNRLGQGEVYIRTGKGSSLNYLTWEKWSTLQRNVNVGEVGSLDDLKDNGIYSGVWLQGHYNSYPLTFVCVVINDYFIGTAPRRISQFVYGLSKFDGSVVYQSRVWDDSKDKWSDWEILNKNEINSMITDAVDVATKAFNSRLDNLIDGAPEAFDTLKEIADWIANDKTGAVALANAIANEKDRAEQTEQAIDDKIDEEVRRATEAEGEINQNAIAADSLRYSTTTDDISLEYETLDGLSTGSVTFPAATTEKAGVMSAEDKKVLDSHSIDTGNYKISFHTIVGTHPYGRFFLKKNYNYRFVFEETGYSSPLYKALFNNKDRATLVASTTGGEFSYKPTEDVEAYLSLYSGSEGDVTVAVTSLPVLQKEIADNLAFEAMPIVPYVVSSKYIKYADGSQNGSGSYFTQYVYDVANYVGRELKVSSYSPDLNGAVVAFYSSATISTDTYLKESSVQASGGYEVVDITIPEGAVTMVVTHRNVDDFTKPVVLMKGLVEKPCSSAANKDSIDALANIAGVVLSSSYIKGYYNTNTGALAETNSVTTAVSEMFIAVDTDTEYVVKDIEGYKLAVYFYDAEKGFVKNKKWFSDGNSFVTESDTAYVRIALRKDDIVLSEIPTVRIVENQDESTQNDDVATPIYVLSKGGRITFEDGSFVTAGTYWEYAKVDVRGLKDIEVMGNWYDGIVAAIAFYTEDGVYLKDASVAGSRGESTKSAAVPTNAAYAICSSAEFTPVVRTHSIGAVVDAIPTRLIDPLRALYNPFIGKPLYHHLNQEQLSAIPAQSLYDIAYAKALGFQVIEANVHKCADGVYVTKHGSSGKLGAGLVFAEGCGITADTAFDSVTSADLRAYVTYDTPLPQYAGHIPTLDEFCAECKRLGMMIFLRVMNDNASLAIARKYFLDSEIILCGAKERGDFTGIITTFQDVDDSTTVESVLNVCDSFGKPYVFGGFWSSSMSDNKVREIVTALHKNGYLAGAAYAETLAIRRLVGLGVDMFASMADVNLFDAGNVNNVFSFDKFDIESGDVALENGVANMSQGAVLRLSDAAFENNHGKVLVSLLFDGELNVQFGNIKTYTVASDGTEWITMARVIGRSDRVIALTALTDTVIKGVKVLSSVVI